MSDEMNQALRDSRAEQGKETQDYHISNEYRMLQEIVLGMPPARWAAENGTGADILEAMTPGQLAQLEALKKKNTGLIIGGMEFAERKKLLSSRAGGMSELAIVEIDALLKLVNAFRMTKQEVIKLDKAGHAPVDMTGYYTAALQVLQWRTDSNANATQQIDELITMAAYDGVELEAEAPEIPQVNIPIFGIGLL